MAGFGGFGGFLAHPSERQLVLAPDERVLLEVPHDKRALHASAAALVLACLTASAWYTWAGGVPFSTWWPYGMLLSGLALLGLTAAWRSFLTSDRVVTWSFFRKRELRFVDVASCGWTGSTLSLEPRDGGRPVRVRLVRDRASVDARLKDAGLKPVTRG